MTKFSLLSRGWQSKLVGSVAIVGTLFSAVGERVVAQIVPDNTLGAESSRVTPNVVIRGIPSDQIEGGAIRGTNLFHSFEQLSVLDGRGAYFSNPPGIENILTRVTGVNRSEILGRLGVLGNANLFLINPKGIVFGPNANLDVQGSFLATTAEAVKLGDAGLFSASEPATSNLLTVNPSAFLFNAIAAQPIVNQSQAQSLIGQPNSDDTPPGLQVQPGRTLALVGGDVFLEGGNLTAAGGRIELGSVAGVGQVSLSQTGNRFVLGYDSVSGFGNISLSNGAFMDASGEGGGDIQIRGTRLQMGQGSDIRADTLGTGNGGEVFIKTTEAVSLSEGSQMTANVAPTGTGTGGNLTIDTGHLLVSDGAQVATGTLSKGKGGSLQVRASESVELIGGSANGQFPSGLFTNSQGNFDPNNPGTPQNPNGGDAGDLMVDTKRLIVRDGAQIISGTRTSGKGGTLQIKASDSIELSGISFNGFPSGLFTTSEGNFNLNNPSNPQIPNGGDAGDLMVDTKRLIVRDGAQVISGTLTSGKGGTLQIKASDSIELSGTSPNGFPSSLTTGSSRILPDNFIVSGTGKAGNLILNTGQLLLHDGAQISTNSLGEGLAGDINLTVRDTLQANNGTIRTDSTQSRGGTITITAGAIRLFGNSDIKSNVASGADNGGNITLTAHSILAFGDSDILAFARDGRGGDITLNTPAFFGENYRPAPPNTNPDTLNNNNRVDINASGAVSGIITTPDVSLIQNSLTELPDNQINTDSLLANSCIVRRNQPTRGTFFITGTGGLPQRPGDAPMSTFPTVDIETLPTDSTPSTAKPNRPWHKGDPIIEPQGVYRLPNGKLVLSRECPQ